MLGTGIVALVAGFSVALSAATDAVVRSGFEDALAVAKARPRARVVPALGTGFDPTALHLGQHVTPGDSFVLPFESHPLEVVRGDQSLPRPGERLVMSTAEGQFDTLEVTSVAPVLVAPQSGEDGGIAATARQARGGIDAKGGTHVLVTLQSIDVGGDSQPRRTLRLILEIQPSAAAVAPIAPGPAKVL